MYGLAAERGPLQAWASQQGLPSDLLTICGNDKARKWVLDQLNATAKESKLRVSNPFALSCKVLRIRAIGRTVVHKAVPECTVCHVLKVGNAAWMLLKQSARTSSAGTILFSSTCP